MEVALDLALQGAPDHPWVTEHPEWFTTRPDGSIAYAENPPKKYQDIYPLNFDNDPEGIYAEMLRVVRLWVDHGVKIFRVDNPHTKPMNFWHWLIGEVKKTDPDVLFLAEAFTRPAMMHALARIGFTQSLHVLHLAERASGSSSEYGRELVAAADYMRPNFFVNTPDILHASACSTAGRRCSRSAPCWPPCCARPGASTPGTSCSSTCRCGQGSEEYLDSEKYQLRPRDYDRAHPGGPLASRRTWPQAQPAAARAPGAAADCATCASTTSTTTTCCAFSKRDDDDRRHRDRGRAPSTRIRCNGATTSLDMPALGLDWNDRVDRARRAGRRRLRVGAAQRRPARPARRAGAHPRGATVDQESAWSYPPTPTPARSAAADASDAVAAARAGRGRAGSHRAGRRGGDEDSLTGLSARRPTRSGTSGRSSTRCWSGRSPTPNGDGTRRPARPDRQAGLPALAGRRLPVAAAVLRLAAARRRLRHQRLPGAARVRHRRGLRRAARRGARARHPGHHRPRHEPHLATRTRGSRSPARDPDGPYGDFYVWADDDTGYPDARIIFVDTEPSNWTFDPVRKQYFWHRFFSHQPDLNFDNPAVQRRDDRRAAVLARPRHRRVPAGRGAVPVRAGGHQLREPAGDPRVPQAAARKMVDDEYPDRVLLAEANQWPADVVEYFGDPRSAATSATWRSTSR